MVALRPFKREDWFGFAGAESFEDGSDPLIGEIEVHDLGVGVVMLDAIGLSICVYREPTAEAYENEEHPMPDEIMVMFESPFAARAVAALDEVEGVSLDELLAMPGAERVS